MKLYTIILSALLSTSAMADTVDYQFSGNWSGVSSYVGSFSIVDPTPLFVNTASTLNWSGDSTTYTGGQNFSVTFANGAITTAPTFQIVVNNTTLAGNGSPYPLGLSVQLYPQSLSVTGMTATKICSVSPCGPDDDPIFEKGDENDTLTKNITGLYFAFYNRPQGYSNVMPNLETSFGAASGGLGIYSVDGTGANTTTLTSLSSLNSQTTISPVIPAVPEPSSYALMLAGLLAICFQRKFSCHRSTIS